MIYVLLNLESANQEGTFRSERDALTEVRDAVNSFGRSIASAWALGYWDEHDELHAVAEGDALIDRAFRTIPA